MSKQCGECSKCCDGWLHANIRGNVLSPGNKCIFLTNDPNGSCSIHKDRPIKPCQIFSCIWLITDMPEHLKPSLSGVIAMNNKIDGVPYVFLVNAPNYPTDEIINWFKEKEKYSNLLYFDTDDNIVYIGETKFIEVIELHKDDIIKQHLDLAKHYIKQI